MKTEKALISEIDEWLNMLPDLAAIRLIKKIPLWVFILLELSFLITIALFSARYVRIGVPIITGIVYGFLLWFLINSLLAFIFEIILCLTKDPTKGIFK